MSTTNIKMDKFDFALEKIALSQMLYDIIEARGEELTFADGVVRRVFMDPKTKEAVIETAWGSADYALDAGVVLMNWALEAYQTEYPDEYAAFIEEYRNRPPELSITLTKENIDSFFESEAN